MVQSLQLQSQQSRGDFHHFVHLKDILPIVFFFPLRPMITIYTVKYRHFSQLLRLG